MLCTCAAAHDAFDTCETAILEELAGDLAFGIVTLRARAEHARAEAALARSERHLRSIYEHSPLAYQALDAEGRYTEVNAAWCAMMGRAREDVLGTRHAAHLLPESAAGLQALLADINAIDELHGIEFEVRHPDGRRLEVELDIKTGRDESGRRPELHCLLHDITQRKATERVLMHHAAIIASSDDAIIGESLDGMITSWNSGAERMFGHLRDEVVGRPITLLVPDALHDEEVMIRRRIMQGTTVSHYQTVRLRKDGSQIEVSVTVSPLRDGNGALVGASLIARDITEQKLAEQELRLAATAFESKEGMFITDADANILRVNRAFTEITGFGAEDCIGRKPFMAESACQEAAFHADMWETLRRDGAWAGEIWNQRKNGERYPEWRSYTAVRDDAGEITHFVGTITDITQRKAAEEEIRELAFYDQLTRLPNRRLLMDRLKQAMAASSRSGRQGALLFIDLDNFKTLNDTSGHDIGDLLLKQVAQRLVECVREGDTVARIGGDEFVVMLEGLSAESHEAAAMAQVVGDKIIATLNRPYLLAGHEHRSTPSIGAALFIDSVISLDELLKQADIAMYQAKSGGRNTLRFFNPEMQAALTARARLEADLRHGLVDEQFLLHFQSQVDQDDRVTGAEVLLRWQHPLHGTVPPSEFIPLAEDTGLILPLGRWVLESACRQLAAWASQPELAHLRLAVNVSPRQFHQRDFVDQVRQALAGSGADPRLLELELTESLLLEDVEDTVQKMTALKREGLRFSLDDFGTGYSSLSYLKRLPLDQLKIDQSFVHDVLIDGNDAAIAKTIVALARSLGLDVIAEGVETLEQRDFLARQDCRAYQGYLFGRPLPIREFERFAAITPPS
ncbi:MAG: EAL domain-containing protein [Rhodocyclaceae bacterium]